MAESTEQSKAAPRITLVCTGKTYLESGHIGIVFHEVSHNGILGDRRLYDIKNFRHVRVASVYDVEIAPDASSSIYSETLRWLRLWDDKAQAAGWQTMVDAFDTRDLAIKHERKETARKLPVELLAPIREQYWSTNEAGRLAIEVRLLAYLRRVKIVGDLG